MRLPQIALRLFCFQVLSTMRKYSLKRILNQWVARFQIKRPFFVYIAEIAFEYNIFIANRLKAALFATAAFCPKTIKSNGEFL